MLNLIERAWGWQAGGSGMRYRDEQLNAGDELRDGTHSYVVERVEQPAHEHALGHAWVRLVDE